MLNYVLNVVKLNYTQKIENKYYVFNYAMNANIKVGQIRE